MRKPGTATAKTTEGPELIRWFLGLNLDERVPDHSTISQNRRRRFQEENIFRRVFEGILRQCIEKGLVKEELILTDATHVKANASFKKNIQVLVEHETKNCFKYSPTLDGIS